MEENNQVNPNLNEVNSTEPVVEPTAEPVTAPESISEPVAEPVTDQNPTPVVEPTPEPVVTPEPIATPQPVVTPNPEPVAIPNAEPTAVATTEPPKKNTPIVIIVLIIALCALVGLGVWYFGSQKAKEKEKPAKSETPSEPVTPSDPTEPTTPGEPTNPTEPTEPTEPSEPTTPTEPTEPSEPTTPSTNKQKLSCEQKEDNYTMTLNFNYSNKKLISGDSLYVFDFSEYATDPTSLAALKQQKWCETVKSDPSVATIFTDCKESWSDNGILTLTFNISLEALTTEYNKVDIDSLKTSFTNEGMACTIK